MRLPQIHFRNQFRCWIFPSSVLLSSSANLIFLVFGSELCATAVVPRGAKPPPGCDLVVFPASSQQGWDNSRSPKSTRNRNTNHEIAKECVPSVMKTIQHCPPIHLYVSFHPSFYHLLSFSIYSSLSLSTFKYFSIHSASIPASISTKKMQHVLTKSWTHTPSTKLGQNNLLGPQLTALSFEPPLPPQLKELALAGDSSRMCDSCTICCTCSPTQQGV